MTIICIQTSTATVTQAPPKTDTDNVAKPDSAAGDGGKRPYVTRDDQLRMKAVTKAKRGKAKGKGKGKDGKKCKKRGGNSRKAKKTHSRRLNTLRALSPSPKKRKARLAINDAEHDAGAEAEATAATGPTGSSCDNKIKTRKTRKAKVAHETPEHVESQPAKIPKAKAAAKTRASPKAKSRASKKADPKVSAKAKAKARGRPKSTPPTSAAMVQQMKASHMYVGNQCETIRMFCIQVQQRGGDKATSPSFKKAARSFVPRDLEMFYIQNIYWTRGSVGVTSTESGKDVLHFSFNQSSASEAYKMAAAVKCAIIAVTQHFLW